MRRILAISIGVMLVFGVVGIAGGAGKEPQEKQRAGQEVSPAKPDLSEEASEKAKVKLEKIWERKFDEEIKDVAFEESEITVREAIKMGIKGLAMEKPGKKIRIPYPRMVVTKKSIKFLDKWGKIKKEYPIRETIAGKQCTKLKFSKNKKYIGISEQNFGYETKEKIKFTMLNENGQLLWALDDLDHPSIYPSPNGKYAVGLGVGLRDAYFDEAPHFYNSKGLFKKEETWPEELETERIDFSRDGSLLTLTATSTKPNAKREGYLMLFNEKGNMLWRERLEAVENAGGVEISPNGKFIATSGSLSIRGEKEIIPRTGIMKIKELKFYVFLFDGRGNQLWKKQVVGGEYIFKFSHDNERLLAICIGLNYLYLFETKSGRLCWEYNGKNLEGKFRLGRVIATPGLHFILVTAPAPPRIKMAPDYGSIRDSVYLFSGDGELIAQKKFDPYFLVSEPYYLPYAEMSSNGKWVTIGTKKGAITYRNWSAE